MLAVLSFNCDSLLIIFNTLQAVSQFDVPLEQVVPSSHLLRNICEDLLHIQVRIFFETCNLIQKLAN